MRKVALDPIYFSVTLVKIENGSVLGTGFFFWDEKNQDLYLVTAKHLIFDGSCRDLETETIKIQIHENYEDLTENITYTLYLFKNQTPLWKSSKNIDVILIKILEPFKKTFIEKYNIFPFSAKNLFDPYDRDYKPHLPENLALLGYPRGIYDDVHNLPILLTGNFGSAYPVYYKGNPYFLVEGIFPEGTSGAPIIILSKYPNEYFISMADDTGKPNNRRYVTFFSKLVGINVGSLPNFPQLNRVFFAETILHILKENTQRKKENEDSDLND